MELVRLIRPDFGTEPVREPWEDALCAHGSAQVSSNPGAIAVAGMRKFLEKNERVAKWRSYEVRLLMQSVAV